MSAKNSIERKKKMSVAKMQARKVSVKLSLSVVTNYFKDEATKCYNNKKFKSAVFFANQVLKVQPNNTDFKLFKAECFMYLDKMEKIEDVPDYTEPDRIYLKSLRSFYDGKLDETIKILCGALALNPCHQQSKSMLTKVEKLIAHRVNGDRSSMEKQYRDVIQACTDVMEAPKIPFTLRIELLYNRAVAHLNVGFVSEAISDCNHVLEERNNDVRMLLLRAQIQDRREEYKKSIEDYTMALSIQSVQITSKIEQLKNASKHQDAEQHKATGDGHFDQKRYPEALLSYDSAIGLWPENVSFLKQRIACFMKLADYRRVIQESKSAHLININCPEIHEYLTECHLALGDVSNAADSIQKCTEMGTQQNKINGYRQQFDILQKSTKKAEEHYRNGDFESALVDAVVALTVANASCDLQTLKGDCLAVLGRLREGVKCLEEVIALDPDHDKAKQLIFKLKIFQEKKEAGYQSYSSKNYQVASENLSEAIELISIECALITPSFYYKLAVSLSKIRRVRDAIKRCTEAIKKKWLPLDFLRLRALCYMRICNFRMAIEDYQALFANSSDAKELLEEAQSALKRSQSNDHYDTLDIPKTASQNDIEEAYKYLANFHHLDEHTDAPANETIEHEEFFKKIRNAYDTLSDPHKKMAYDQRNASNNKYNYYRYNRYNKWNYHN